MGKTTRNAISNDQKREISQYKKDNPKAKNVELISHFEKKFLFIGKYKRPRCFGKHFDPNKIVDYYNNTAWMVVPIWDDWLIKLVDSMITSTLNGIELMPRRETL